MEHIKTDCRTDEGVTVALIDTIINSARLLIGRTVTQAVSEALADLRQDEDVARLFTDQLEAVAIVEYTGYEPAISLRWLNKGLNYMKPDTTLYAIKK